ncbi:hypothetical protein QEH58_15950 [Roseibacillus persicicus]|uniref:Membrane protein n=1 Tax=Roseibacillus persicicus TaxID=454148 RepID=A0A918TR48_9BACT|nr:hypothetical protein [Roseibacillus persicicus]MDQ8191801.1 hypothetical protein [Roseibacillus persicicus]GHC58407.1 membrane protein [Roseibacillus persicicus]
MGHRVTSADIPVNGEQLPKSKVQIVMFFTGAIALLGLITSAIFLWGNPEKASELKGNYSFSWLFAVFYFFTIALGGCFWTLLHNVSNSGWGTSIRRLMENVGFVFPFIFVFAIPLLFPSVQAYLFEWMTEHRDAISEASDKSAPIKDILNERGHQHDGLLANKAWYMNLEFWHGRFLVFFLGLSFVIWKLRKLSVDQDTCTSPGTTRLFKARAMSSWGIAVFAVTLTFIAVDWVMGLDYTWFSTMWGVYVFAGSALNSMAVIVIVSILLRKAGYLKKVVGPEHDHLMGKLMFAFTIFWAYISFSQFFLYWYANVTEETRYFILRNTENWNILSYVLVFGHFGAPFLLLLRSDVKKKNIFMLIMAVYLLGMHFLDVYHMIIPERGPSVGNIVNHDPKLWMPGAWIGDIIAFIIVGCGFVFFLLRNLTSVSLYPHRDPRILESANVHN